MRFSRYPQAISITFYSVCFRADGNPRMRSPSPVKIEDKPRRKPRSKNWDKKPWDEGPSQKMGGLELQLKSRSRSPSPKSQFPWSKGSRSPKRSRAKSPSRRRSRSRSRERRRDSSRDRHSSEERDYSNTDTSNSSSQNRSRRKFTESVPSKWDFKTATSHWDEGDEDSPTDPSKPRTKRKFQEGPATFKTAGVRKFAEVKFVILIISNVTIYYDLSMVIRGFTSFDTLEVLSDRHRPFYSP